MEGITRVRGEVGLGREEADNNYARTETERKQ